MEAALGGDIDHLFGEDEVAGRAGLEGGPVAGAGDEWTALCDDLVVHDVEAAGEVARGLQDGAVGVVFGERAVGGVVEGAVVALGVLVLELEQALLAREAVGFGIDLVHGSVGVVDVGGGVESGFGGSDGLEGVGPEGALVGVRELGEAWAVSADGVGGLRGEKLGRKGLFDECVPGRVPGFGAAGRVTEFSFLFGDGCGWGGFGDGLLCCGSGGLGGTAACGEKKDSEAKDSRHSMGFRRPEDHSIEMRGFRVEG